MKTARSSKSSSPRFGLIIFLILGLFLCAVFLYVRNYKTKSLARDFKQLSSLRSNYEQIDSCVILLYHADNQAKLYAVTAQKAYIKEFIEDIDLVSSKLEELKSSSDIKPSADDLQDLIKQKQVRTELYFKLRSLTDSLMTISAGIDTGESGFKTVRERAFVKKQLQTLVAIDTIREVSAPKQGKKLFGRIADAIANRQSKVEKSSDTSQKLIRTSTESLGAVENDQTRIIRTNAKHDSQDNDLGISKLLKKNEIAILQLNEKIIAEIVSLLENYKASEKEFTAHHKETLNQNITFTFKSISQIFVASLIILFSMVLAILYNLFKIYKNENDLISSSHKATEFALSKSRFLANMSHEIRTPLNSVIGFSEQLGQSKLDEQQAAQVSAIRSSSVILLDVVNDILDFAKYESYKVNFDQAPFHPYEILNEILQSIKILAKQKGLDLKAELSFDPKICFSGDSLRLKQVIMNLLSNAIKFTEEGSVVLKADIVLNDKRQGLLKVQVLDTGVGLAAKDRDMIFDEFAQVQDVSNQPKQIGTGLGLAICKKIVEFQGGKIEVSSELGKGSNFSFEIPYELSDEVSEVTDNESVVDLNILANKRILLVDDNKMNILLAQTVIKKYKIVTDVAYNGKEALDLFEKNRYDLVLTDIQMPEMNGEELTVHIRLHSDPLKRNIVILGLTANVLQDDRKRYLESGMNDLVLKPFTEKELVDKIATYLKQV